MSTFCHRGDDADRTAHRRLVDSAEAALDVLHAAAHDPPRHEVIALVLDDEFIGSTIVVVDGTTSPDCVITVMEMLAETAAEAGRTPLFVLASFRPDSGPLPGDIARWLELDELAVAHGCELVDWYVISDGVAWCPRDFVVTPPRWPSPC